MECQNEHFRHILLFYFSKGKKAAQTAIKLRDVYGEEALKDSQSRADILVGRRSGPDREKCGPDRVICLAPDQ